MGQEILYCFKCQERVTTADLDASNALRFGTRTACRKCVPDLLASLSAQERKELVSRVQGNPEKKGGTGRHVLSTATPRPRTVQAVPSRPANPLQLWGFIGGAGIGILIILGFATKGGAPPEAPRETTNTASAPKGPEESPRDRAAREAVAKAKALPAADLEGKIAAFAQAMKAADGTSYAREAKEMHDELVGIRRKALLKEVASVEARARAVVLNEEFAAAIAIFEAIRPLHADAEWKELVDAKVIEVKKAAELALVGVKAKAAADPKAARERVARWGLPEKAADLEAHLASAAAPADVRPWIPLFDGKSLDFMSPDDQSSWRVENGMLVHVVGKKGAGQSRRAFGNGEIRTRLQWRGLQSLGFSIRQGVEGAYSIFIDRPQLDQLEGRDHDLLWTFRGKDVAATLDGQPLKVIVVGAPAKGQLQFNAQGDSFVVKLLEYREDPMSEGLVAYWTLDAIAGGKLADASGNGHDGTAMYDPKPMAGKLNGALECDRKSYVDVPAAPDLNLSGPFTLVAWVKMSPASGVARGVVEKWDGVAGGMSGWLLRINIRDQIVLMVADPGGNVEIAGVKVIPADTWTCVAGVFDGATLKVYVNGALDRSTPCTKAPKPTAATLRLGTGGGGGGNHLMGGLDEVRIYNRALAADEIAALAK